MSFISSLSADSDSKVDDSDSESESDDIQIVFEKIRILDDSPCKHKPMRGRQNLSPDLSRICRVDPNSSGVQGILTDSGFSPPSGPEEISYFGSPASDKSHFVRTRWQHQAETEDSDDLTNGFLNNEIDRMIRERRMNSSSLATNQFGSVGEEGKEANAGGDSSCSCPSSISRSRNNSSEDSSEPLSKRHECERTAAPCPQSEGNPSTNSHENRPTVNVFSSSAEETDDRRDYPILGIGDFEEVALARPMAFMKFADEHGNLNLKLLKKNVATIDGNSIVQKPLACSFHKDLGFLFAGPNKVYRCREDGTKVRSVLSGLRFPSAIVAVSDSVIAVLDNNRLGLYYVSSGMLAQCLMKDLSGRARGLTLTDSGMLLTCVKMGFDTKMFHIFDLRNNILTSSSYLYGDQNGLPCFMSSSCNQVFVTDLGAQKIVHYDFRDRSRLLLSNVIDLCAQPMTKYFTFVSGVVADRRGELLVADATRKSLFLISANFKRMDKVIADDWPYAAGFAVSPNGYVMVANRKDSRMMLFRFRLTKDEFDDPDELKVETGSYSSSS